MDAIDSVGQVGGGKQLTPQDRAEIARLAARDRDVRAHEAAHLAAAGALASGIEFDYEMGPDGKLYAVGGRVKISVPGGLTPEQALAAARQMRAAATAPTDPSGQDLSVAAQASAMEAQAQAQLDQQKLSQPATKTAQPAAPANFREFNRVA
ncbi:MAG: putative metalloprotease CJM1_0395 family protein [Verrucomicrobiota bacterium]